MAAEAAASIAAGATPWALIPMVASMAMGARGQYEATSSMVSGAESQAAMEKMGQDYQTKVFLEGVEKQKPFYEAGKAAIPLYEKALGGEAEPTRTGLGAMERRMVEADTKSMSDHVKGLVSKRLEAAGGEKIKGRLMDIMQIGLGQSGSAGKAAVNLGGRLASSMQRGGGALASAQMAKDIGRQNIYTQTLESLSGLPAYMASRPEKKRVTAPNPPMGAGYLGDSRQYGGSYA